MPTNEERAAFSKRLELALRRSPEPVRGATDLALRFNLKYHGNAISAQTAHKWLTGRAIPTSDKLATLAAWLNVNEHWLHYGPPPAHPTQVAEPRSRYGAVSQVKSAAEARNALKPSPESLELAFKIQMLPPQCRYLVEELVQQLQPKL